MSFFDKTSVGLMASSSFDEMAKQSAILLQAFKSVFDSKQMDLLLNLVQTEVGMQTLW